MTIHCFGDSWVHGTGCEILPGSGQLNTEERYTKDWSNEKLQFSWPGQLKTMINNKYNVVNYGSPGFSNFQIYTTVIDAINNGSILKNDVVIVSMSSIIREPLNFLYTQKDTHEFINYSNSNLSKFLLDTNNSDLTVHWLKNLKNSFKKSTMSVYVDYLANRFNYDLLYEICANYICNLQIYFKEYGVKYIFTNSFESNISKKTSIYKQINLKNWILPHSSLQEYLLNQSYSLKNTEKYSVWEDDIINVNRNEDGPHPNRIGYNIIATLIKTELEKRNYLNESNRII